MNKYISIIILLIISSIASGASAQKKSRILIKNSNVFKIDRKLHPGINMFIGDVFIIHQDIKMYCDSAYQYEKLNVIEAFGHVHIINADTINIYGNYLKYDGNSKLAQLKDSVILKNQDVELTTNRLDFDMNNSIGYYNEGGKIVDKTNTLTSRIGKYYTKENMFFFKDSVIVKTPDYTIYSDTLKYNTEKKIVYILGPTDIIGEKETLYSEYGWYNTELGVSHLLKNSKANSKGFQLKGDSIYINKNEKLIKAYHNIELLDTINHIILRGNYMEMHKDTEEVIVTDSTLLIQINKTDSTFLHSDTIRMTKDSLDFKILMAYNRVKFYGKQMQGMCDSMSYTMQDSTIRLFNKPVIWTQGNQIIADTIAIESKNNVIRFLHFRGNAFLCSEVDSTLYNQIKGRNMLGYVNNNELTKLDVLGNGETLYFPKDANNIIMGMNVAKSSNLTVKIAKRKIDQILFLTKPEGNLYPIFDIINHKRLLTNFQWLNYLRPKSKEDIYIWKENTYQEIKAPKIVKQSQNKR